jgi:hypothetical protein
MKLNDRTASTPRRIQIAIDHEVLALIQAAAVAPVDDANAVLRRLLGLHASQPSQMDVAPEPAAEAAPPWKPELEPPVSAETSESPTVEESESAAPPAQPDSPTPAIAEPQGPPPSPPPSLAPAAGDAARLVLAAAVCRAPLSVDRVARLTRLERSEALSLLVSLTGEGALSRIDSPGETTWERMASA